MSAERTRTEMTCFHEVGHAVIAYHFGITNLSIDLKIGSDVQPGVVIILGNQNALTDYEKLVFYMGGYAGEKLYTDIFSEQKMHFSYLHVRNIFNQTIDESIELDMKNARDIIHQSDASFDLNKSYTLIEKAKSDASGIVSKKQSLMFNLFKELLDQGGSLSAEDIGKVCSPQQT